MNSAEYHMLHAQIQLLKQHVVMIERTLASVMPVAAAAVAGESVPARVSPPPAPARVSPPPARSRTASPLTEQTAPTVRILQRPAPTSSHSSSVKQGIDVEPLTVPVRGPMRGPMHTRRAASAAATASSSASSASTGPAVPFDLADVLQEGETMVIKIRNTASEEEGAVHTAVVQYDGTELTVMECEKVPSLVGKKAMKAGNLVYAFIQGLYFHKEIARTFSLPPWKLCYVKHDGVWLTLNEVYKAKFPHGPFPLEK